MGATSSKRQGGVIKTKVRVVGRMSLVRKQTSERRREMDELKRKRGEAISVFDDSSDGDISREDIKSLPLKNGGHFNDGERNDAYSNISSLDEFSDVPKVGLCLSDFKRVTRKKTLDEFDSFFSIPYKAKAEIDDTNQCHVCEVFTGHEIYPCRICGKAFHKSCLQKLGRCQKQADVNLLHCAKTDDGWTCYLCDDLTNLLTEEELTPLTQALEEHGLYKGTSISKEEFLRFSSDDYTTTIDKDGADKATVHEDDEFKFGLMDTHHTGKVSWCQFINYTSIQILSRRTKSTLVPLLTGREVELTRRVFHTFDTTNDGFITEQDAKKAKESWYSLFYSFDGPINGYAILSETKELTIDHRRTSVDNVDENGMVSWENFLTEQALHILAMRPNKCRIPVGEKAWLELMMLPVTRNITKDMNFLAPEDDSRSDTSGLSSTSIEQIDIS